MKRKFIVIFFSSAMACFIAAYLVSIFLGSCNQQKNNTTENNNNPSSVKTISAPGFNADSAYLYTQKQVDFGPRIPGTPAQTKCAEWLTAQLKRFCKNVVVQESQVKIYDGRMVPMKNIIASFNPDTAKRILLFAHWDTRPFADRDSVNKAGKFDGADDAASGVGTLLEIARQISIKNLNVGVDIAFFDVEDYGPPSYETKYSEQDAYCLGTQYWCNNPHKPNYRAYYGVLLDMTGAKGAQFRFEGLSNQYAPSVLQNIWNTAAGLGYSNYFLNEKVNEIIDDHWYVNKINGTPSIDIIWLDPTSHTGFAPHWHTHADNMSLIDKGTLKAVGQTLLQVIYNEPST